MTVIMDSTYIQLFTIYGPAAISAAAPTGMGAVYAPVSVTHV